MLNHPTWNMGAKITVDSAGMINKALELIEAHYLFGFSKEKLGAVIHPQSYIHAIIEHHDGSWFFHVSNPDMVFPVAYSLFYPEEPPQIVEPEPVSGIPELVFEEINIARFPGFEVGLHAREKGGSAPCIFNAANEMAVKMYLDGEIEFYQIPIRVEATLSASVFHGQPVSFEELLEADQWARQKTAGR